MSTETTPVESREIARIRSDRSWYGYLTLENCDAVADRLRRLLDNGQRYTRVYANEGMREYRPEVRTGCVASPITVSHAPFEGKPAASIVWGDHFYYAALLTSAADQQAAASGEERWRPSWLEFEDGRLTVAGYGPGGRRTYSVFAVEEPEL